MLEASIKSVKDSNAFKDLFMHAIVNNEPDNVLIKQYKSLSKKSNELEL